MSKVTEIHDLTDSDDGMQLVKSRSLSGLNYEQGGSDNRIRIPNPVKRRQIDYGEYPNFDRQYIQNINIPTSSKPESDNDVAVQNKDDNYHFLMSLLPYLREVPKNRKMAVRHKLQKVFIDEQERKSGGKNINVNYPNLNNFPTPFANVLGTDPLYKPQQTPRLPPPPYPYKQDSVYNYVPSAAGASALVPLPNASASTSTFLGSLLVQQPPNFPEYSAPVGLTSGHQQRYNAPANNNVNNANNNNSSFIYNATAVNSNSSYFGCNATAVDNNNANNNNANNNNANNNNANNNNANNNNANNNNNSSSFGYNATAVDNNSSFFGCNATATNNNNANNNSSLSYNTTAVENDNTTFIYQSGVTGEPQTFTYLQ